MTVSDPAGDVPTPQGDITAAGFAENATQFAFGVKAAQPVDPATDPAWQAGGAQVAWALDRNDDGQPDYFAVALQMSPTDIEAAFLAFSGPNPQPCFGTFVYILNSGYRATFPTVSSRRRAVSGSRPGCHPCTGNPGRTGSTTLPSGSRLMCI